MAERPIDEQFAALPDAIKGRLFHVLDVVLGASHDEKDAARLMLTQSYEGELPEPVPALLNALAALVMHADAQAGQDYTAEELDRDGEPVREAVRDLVREIQADPETALGTGLMMDAMREQFALAGTGGRKSGLYGALADLVVVAAGATLEKGSVQ